MGKYSDAFDEAEKEFDEEFGGKLVKSDFSDKALEDLCPEGGPDREAMLKFIAEARAAVDAEKAKEAWLKLGGKVGGVLLKAAKKAITGGVMLAFLAMSSWAGVVSLNDPLDWLKEHANKSRAGGAVNFRAEVGGAAYLPLAWDKRHGYWEMGVGYTHFEKGVDHATAAFSINLVTTFHDGIKRLLGHRVGVLPLPDLWLGPYIEAPPLDNIREKWVIGERTGIQFVWRCFD